MIHKREFKRRSKSNITEGNKLTNCGALAITQLFGVKGKKIKKKDELFCK